MTDRENILDAVSRAGVVVVRSIANNPLWLCAVVTPVSFVAALAALSLGERAFGWAFLIIGAFTALFAASFITYFAFNNPDRLQSESFQLEQRRLTLQS